jgi:hypothetical protein
MNSISIKIVPQFGKERFFPADKAADLFCEIAGAKTLTREKIECIKQLGYEVKVVHDITSL